ncbi:MAG: hypothetical protein LRS46_03270 [Desulfurococcales archaeon]|nr:hypothetical protein [Desulfurococcales archaeon]
MRARRALSPIVSVILLILVAVGATVILYSWLSGAASNNPTQTGSLYERIKIDAVQVGTSNNVSIYVSNIGKTSVTLVGAYIINATSGTTICHNTSLNSLKVPPGGSATVEIQSCDSISGATGVFVAKVVTSNGIEATYTFTK